MSIPRNLRFLQRKVILTQWGQNAAFSSRALPMNTVILFVPQQEAWVVERFGKFNRILDPGLNFIFPIVDKVKYVQSLKEVASEVPEQAAVTSDNVTLGLDGVLYTKVFDPYKCSYNVENAEFAIKKMAQTTMRSEIGKITLDTVFRERETLNVNIVDAINKASEPWGISCLRYEIRDMTLPLRIQEAMQMQVEAERKKRASILESEGIREADINVAEGKKRAKILNSEAFQTEQINIANGEARAIQLMAEAKAKAVTQVAEAIGQQNGMNAVGYSIAEQYVDAFGKLAKTNNTMILPANTGDVGGMVAQAMTVYKNLSNLDQIKSETAGSTKKNTQNITFNPES
eukprot:XP_011419466.1 PREDICTED: stomatin-like protein 2, mitochondrial [Crassostrea gigas]